MASRAEIARVAAGAQRVPDNPYRLGTRGFWAVQDAVFERFMAIHDRCLDELRALTAKTGGPKLDGSAESLGPLDEWLAVPVDAGVYWDDGANWEAFINGRVGALWRAPGGLDHGQYCRLQNRVAFYFADVLISCLPGSKWVCWRREEFNLIRTGDFLVDIGTFPTPADPLQVASGAIANAWSGLFSAPDLDYQPDEAYALPGRLEQYARHRAEWEAEGKPLDFQAAPTGDEAGVNRGPYKGSRIRAKIGERRGY
ncbi:MAG: hypothetical protein LBC97_11135 [Bifidobacteriaceae bacterium]|jgi:hypothetical protein|nr:hypothetical protein [Bifidobacteriaceae bacterium]